MKNGITYGEEIQKKKPEGLKWITELMKWITESYINKQM
jgi:hypothetical protein